MEHSDTWTVTLALRGVAAFVKQDPSRTLQTLLRAGLGRATEIADTFFSVLLHTDDLPFEILAEGDVATILEKLVICPSIDNYWIGQFVGKASERYPIPVMEYLIRRLEHDRRDEGGRFDPLPYSWDERSKLQFRESASFR